MKHGHNIIHECTGAAMVYPGHPLVVATAIMKVYPNFEEANAKTESGWCEALSDHRIPGAGCHVNAAMRLLKMGVDGAPAEGMIEYGRRYWVEGRAGGHEKNVEAGQAQAEAVEPEFRAMAATWFGKS